MSYEHLMGLFKDTGHFVEGKGQIPGIDMPKYYSWREIVFNPRRIIGIAVHSLVSGRPRDIYLTDGKHIFYERGKTPKRPPTDSQKEDIIREDLVFQIIDGRPHDICRIYELVDGHLRIADFNSSFVSVLFGDYISYLEKISKEVPAGLIREDEHKHIHRRVMRNRDHIARLLAAMKADEYPLPDFVATVEKKLREYGY
jgi:hypothetical protein